MVQRPYQTNLLIAGHDKGKGPSLFWCDYLATMHKMNVAGTGYGALVQGSVRAPAMGWQSRSTCRPGPSDSRSCLLADARAPMQARTSCCPCWTGCGTLTSQRKRPCSCRRRASLRWATAHAMTA